MDRSENAKGDAQRPSARGWNSKLLTLVAVGAASFVVELLFLAIFFGISTAPGSVGGGALGSIRSALEMLYFAAGIGALCLAVGAFMTARKQLDHIIDQNEQARHSRLASAYIEITNRFYSPEMQLSRRSLRGLMRQFDRLDPAVRESTTLSAFAHSRLLELLEEHLHSVEVYPHVQTRYVKTVRFLDFVEDIAVLVRKNYLKADDVFELMGTILSDMGTLMDDHIRWNRIEGKSRTLYANAAWLCGEAVAYQAERNAGEEATPR